MALCSDVEPPARDLLDALLSSSAWLPVNAWRTSTRLSKSMTCAMSLGFSRWTKLRRRGLQRRQLVFHAGAAVEQQRQRDRLLPAGEEGDFLLDAVLED